MDCRAYLNNIVFYNFNITYTSNSFAWNNTAFVTHPTASDSTAGHYLRNVRCIGCQMNARVYFRLPNPDWNGHYGGCGNL